MDRCVELHGASDVTSASAWRTPAAAAPRSNPCRRRCSSCNGPRFGLRSRSRHRITQTRVHGPRTRPNGTRAMCRAWRRTNGAALCCSIKPAAPSDLAARRARDPAHLGDHRLRERMDRLHQDRAAGDAELGTERPRRRRATRLRAQFSAFAPGLSSIRLVEDRGDGREPMPTSSWPDAFMTAWLVMVIPRCARSSSASAMS
jgi:hypothetical protein